VRRSESRAEAFEEGSSALDWVVTLLWGRGAVVHHTQDHVTDPSRSFHVLPDRSRPRVLIPAGSRIAGSVALRQFNDSMSQFARFRKAAASSALGLGLASWMGGDRVWIEPSRIAGDGQEIGMLLSEIFRRTDLHVSVALGPSLRPNVKPILQVITDSGDVLGYVKVGWNDLTRRLVENEARVVQAWQERPPATFHVPRLVYEGTWNDLGITVVAPVAQHVVRRGRRNALPPIEVILEIAQQVEPASLAGAYLRDLRARVASSSLSDPDQGRVVRMLAGFEERVSSAIVPFGAWHGDFGPWNMSRSKGGLSIWDWERSSSVVPLGFDILHFGFQVSYAIQGSSITTAAREAVAHGRIPLEAMGVPQRAHRDILTAYLIERILRVEEGRANGVQVRSELTGQVLDHLEMIEGIR
jgi:hypothetical protein